MEQDDKAYREALQEESLRLIPGTSRKARLARKAWRNEQRAELGFRPESKLPRGGLAGFVDRNKKVITPIAAGLAGLATGGLLAPVAVGALSRGLDTGKRGIGFDVGNAARGALEGAVAGSVGKFAGGMLQPTPAQFAASIPGAPANISAGGSLGATPGIAAPASGGGFSVGGALNKAKDWLTADGGKNALNLASTAYNVYNQAQGAGMMRDAAKRDAARWAEGAPLRQAGMQGMLQPIPADTSSLDALAGQGNPFARPAVVRSGPPVPGAGTLSGNAGDERAGLQTRPIPATAMRRTR